MNAKLWRLVAGVLLVHLTLLGWLRPTPNLPRSEVVPMQVSLLRTGATPSTYPQPFRSKTVHRSPKATEASQAPIHSATPLAHDSGATAAANTLDVPTTQPTEDHNTMVATPLQPPSTASVLQAPGTALGTPGPAPVAASPPRALPQAKPNPMRTPPSATADYLDNSPPPYPAQSWRRGEQGTVLVRTLISKDGSALDAMLAQSSGFDRLDRAALQAVMQWRYRPATLDGIPQELWFDVPVMFKLN